MVIFFEETDRKRRRTEIIQAQPNTDKKIYEKIVLIGSKRKELPYEIIQDILSRLPTRAAIRLSYVSKLWFSAVSDTYFRNLHYSRMAPNPKPGILQLKFSKNNEDNVINIYLPSSSRAETRLESDIPLYHLNTRQNYEFCNACNGLLCFVSCNPRESIIVCNPLTNEHLTLPITPAAFKKCNYFVAIGFCPSSKRYKLFRLSLSLGHHVDPEWNIGSVLEVCNVVGCNKPWRTISSYLNMTLSGKPLYLDGKIHWVAFDEAIWNDGQNESVIFSVDVCSEKYAYIDIPHTAVAFRPRREATILELEGRLSVAALYHCDVRIYFWVLKDFEHRRWDLRYTCEHLPFPVRDISIRAGEIVGVFSYGNIIYIRLHHRWVFYDTSKDSSKPTPLHYILDESELPPPLTPLHYILDESELPVIPDHGDLLGGFYPSLLSPEQVASYVRQCDIGH